MQLQHENKTNINYHIDNSNRYNNIGIKY
jgi:hypothetical protein